MKRRKFLQSTGAAVTLPMLLNGMNVSAFAKSSLFNAMNTETDRVLVLIQLNGGNDGLNTIIPVDQYDNLANVRSNLIIPENQILSLTDTVGLHPTMTGIKDLYEDAKMAIINSVGYPNQNRSHFRSTDIWTTGSPAEEFWTTGWLGRYFDDLYPGFPEGYPNEANPDPVAITIGSIVSETCQGTSANYSLTLNDPFALAPLTEGAADDVPETPYGEELTFLRTTIAQTNAYSEVVTSAAESGSNLATYTEGNALAQQLKTVALLISGGLKTNIYVVSIGGFDTHANQVVEGDPTVGEHAALLDSLSDAVSSFQQDLQLLGLDERVVTMTFSEFGRQIRSNEAFGTDHGSAAPLMVFGSCVNPTMIGENPTIPDQVEVQEGVPMQYDFRDVYGSVLMDWFEVPETSVQQLLHADFQYIPILQPCTVTNVQDQPDLALPIDTKCFPNPFRNWTTISFSCENEWVKLSIFNALGSQVRVLVSKQLPKGTHEVRFDAGQLAPGNYYYRLQLGSRLTTRHMVKM
jgi:uncharacterized protein (DUF1501 family)